MSWLDKDGHIPSEKYTVGEDGSIKLRRRSQEELLFRVAAKVAALEIRVRQLEKKDDTIEYDPVRPHM